MNNIKKILAIIFVMVLLLSFAACGNKKSNDITLSLDNYQKYLDIKGSTGIYSNKDDKLITNRMKYSSCYAGGNAYVTATSPNFIYNDVKVTFVLKVTNVCYLGSSKEFDNNLITEEYGYVICNAGGSGECQIKYQFKEGSNNTVQREYIYSKENMWLVDSTYFYTDVEMVITDISGTVTPVTK